MRRWAILCAAALVGYQLMSGHAEAAGLVAAAVAGALGGLGAWGLLRLVDRLYAEGILRGR